MTESPQKLYKFVKKDGSSIIDPNFHYSLPNKDGYEWKSGEWTEISGDLVPRSNGLHISEDLHGWRNYYIGKYNINDMSIYEAEYDGECIEQKAKGRRLSKLCCRKIRLIREVTYKKTKIEQFKDKVNYLFAGRDVTHPKAIPKTWEVIDHWLVAKAMAENLPPTMFGRTAILSNMESDTQTPFLDWFNAVLLYNINYLNALTVPDFQKYKIASKNYIYLGESKSGKPMVARYYKMIEDQYINKYGVEICRSMMYTIPNPNSNTQIIR
jgi:hypothetical protein